MKQKMIFALALIVLFASFAVQADAEEIRILAAASLTEAVKEIVTVYQQENPEVKLLSNFASSGALARQISAGAPADIYISANPKWMAYLQDQELIAEKSKQILVRNSLVFVGTTEGVASLADLSGLERVALCSPKSSPAGRYAELAMTEAGIYKQLQGNRQLVLAKDVRQALLYADRGEVDGAFVYQTDAMLAKQAQVLFAVPQELYPQVVYPAALTLEGSAKKGAVTFFAYLFSSLAQDVLRRHGFGIGK